MKKKVAYIVFGCVGFLSITGVLLTRALMGANFSGHQSLNGLYNTTIFQAPATGIYFINGQLSLPQPSLNGDTGASQAQAIVYKNAVTSADIIYVGVSGASGFGIPSVALSTDDTISVSITSQASIDQGINVIRGDVFFGNAF